MKAKSCALLISALAAFFIVLGSGTFYLLYEFFHSIKGDGIVKITSHAVDRGDHIALNVRVANIDTSRYLSNFCFSFSNEPGAYKVILSNIVPMVDFTIKYYMSDPDNVSDEQVIKLDPNLSLTLGQAIVADFVLVKNTNSYVASLYAYVGYRGQRTVEVHPKDYAVEDYNIIPQR
jgi:hypothetical protein